MFAVDYVVAFEVFHRVKPFSFELTEVGVLSHRVKHGHMTVARGVVFLVKVMAYVAESQTVAAHFIGVSRAYAFACGAYFGSSFGFFVSCVKKAVCRHDQMGFLGQFEHFFQFNTALFESFSFFAEENWVKYHAVAYYVGLSVLKYSRRY